MSWKYLAIILTTLLIITVGCRRERDETGTSPSEKKNVVKVDYDKIRIKKFPLAMQTWTFRKFSFFEAVEKTRELGLKYIQAYPGQPLSNNYPEEKFDHTLSKEAVGKILSLLDEKEIKLVAYGVVDLGVSEETMRPVFDFARRMGIEIIVCEPEDEAFPILERLVKEYGIKAALHNHPQPSKYALPEAVLEKINGKDERIGACADPGHWMRSNSSPVESLRLLKGRILDVHLKDRSAFGTEDARDVPLGQGKADIHDILAELTLQDYSGYLTIEYENEEEAENPVPSVRKGLDYIKSITYYEGYMPLLKRERGRYSKHGWNHYGPGYFKLDPQTGILESHGGMGLFWFSERKFKNFVLDLEYKCSDENTNSGIFLRVPELPVSDDYIYHSFEIQINDAGEGVHKTGAVYDAEPPSADAFNNTGEWNHMKITFHKNNIIVVLNGVKIIDWEAEPRGKVADFASEGYIGLQNHDPDTKVYFRNIYIKEL